MAAINHDFDIEQGAKWEFAFIWVDKDDNPVDLTDCRARMQLRQSLGNDIVMLELTTENGMLSIDAATGMISGLVGATKTAQLNKGGVYDLEVIKTDDDVTRLAQGNFFLSKEVTRHD